MRKGRIVEELDAACTTEEELNEIIMEEETVSADKK
jgi:hypothetical protein